MPYATNCIVTAFLNMYLCFHAFCQLVVADLGYWDFCFIMYLDWFDLLTIRNVLPVLFFLIAYFSASPKREIMSHGYAGWTPKRCWGKRYLWADPIPGLSQKYTKYTCKIRCILPPKEPTILRNEVSSWFMCSNGDTRNKQWLWFSMSSVLGLNSY